MLAVTAEHELSEIFIVDDDPLVRDALSEVFVLAGFRAVSFVDGASFLLAARERIPACVTPASFVATMGPTFADSCRRSRIRSGLNRRPRC